MQGTNAFQDAVARAKQIAQKLANAAPTQSSDSFQSLKRPADSCTPTEHESAKRPQFGSSPSSEVPLPVLKAQLVAQQINAHLGGLNKSSSSSAGGSGELMLGNLPLSNQNTITEDYKIPDKLVGLVIGKGGEQITRIQFESGCKVQISPSRAPPEPGNMIPDRLATLSGSRDAIDRAKRMIDDIVSKGKPGEGGGGMSSYSLGGGGGGGLKTIEIMLPSAKCGLIIGKGGENIKRVSEEFGVKMHVIQEAVDQSGNQKPLKITGDADRVERARQYVLDIMAKRDSDMGGRGGDREGRRSDRDRGFNDYGSRSGYSSNGGGEQQAFYHVPADKAGIVIGKGGESIKEINRKSGAFVEIDKTHQPGTPGDRLFKLCGTPDQIVYAQQLMFEKVLHSPGGPGDMLTPLQFQQQFNLPQVGSNQEGFGENGNGNGNGDMMNQQYAGQGWPSGGYGGWPMDPFGMPMPDQSMPTSSSNSRNPPLSTASPLPPPPPPPPMAMDPAWMAYYQSMNFYANMSGMVMPTASTSSTTTTTTSTSTTNATPSFPQSSTAGNTSTTQSTKEQEQWRMSTATATTNPSTGQPDYSQAWIEYYRSIGQNEVADEIVRQMSQPQATGTSTTASNQSGQQSSSSSSTNNAASTANNATAQAAAAGMVNPWAMYAGYSQPWGSS
ncbi:unnamed protein product [Didymodactylos carnosus]|uniref:K Homology domain-containing protein n=1 Tax=Didymodactylos carnosus TaxID=1234261 RepID=A0A813QEB0_9BILA|nr:unnamed protein product [Didymodactylos carnosus]CAF0765750.1 unnamed protein product [Didymodactylos carnosus]CAF3537962.1 unnamed protein product [Didymodactylos carnosus]CAF3547109.1 unnamed protein product [Didymodactylos carnosus]